MLTPADPELEVTLASVFCTESKTPSEESAKYRTATATKSMTQATNEIRKLNFITDHGSSLATTRSARRPRLPPAPAPVLALGRETPEKTAARRLVSAALSPVTAVSPKPVLSPNPAVVSPNPAVVSPNPAVVSRSEERRVGKEGKSRSGQGH